MAYNMVSPGECSIVTWEGCILYCRWVQCCRGVGEDRLVDSAIQVFWILDDFVLFCPLLGSFQLFLFSCLLLSSICWCLLNIFWSCVVRSVFILSVFMINWLILYHTAVSSNFFGGFFFGVQVHFTWQCYSHSCSLWLLFPWYIPFLVHYVFEVQSVSHIQHIFGYLLKIQSDSLCLLIGVF